MFGVAAFLVIVQAAFLLSGTNAGAPIEKFSKANIAYDVNTQEYAGQAETIMGKLLSLLFQFAFPNGLEKDVRGTIQTDKFPLPGGSKPIRPIISDLI